MSVVEGLTKEVYFIVLSRRKTSFHAKFQVQCLHGLPVLTYVGIKPANVLSGLIIISFSRSKRVNGEII